MVLSLSHEDFTFRNKEIPRLHQCQEASPFWKHTALCLKVAEGFPEMLNITRFSVTSSHLLKNYIAIKMSLTDVCYQKYCTFYQIQIYIMCTYLFISNLRLQIKFILNDFYCFVHRTLHILQFNVTQSKFYRHSHIKSLVGKPNIHVQMSSIKITAFSTYQNFFLKLSQRCSEIIYSFVQANLEIYVYDITYSAKIINATFKRFGIPFTGKEYQNIFLFE